MDRSLCILWLEVTGTVENCSGAFILFSPHFAEDPKPKGTGGWAEKSLWWWLYYYVAQEHSIICSQSWFMGLVIYATGDQVWKMNWENLSKEGVSPKNNSVKWV